MADERGWASPTGGSQEEPPRYGERVPGWTPPPQAPATQAPAAPSYAPPPKRGLIPLHPLSFGQLLGAAFATIRWNPRATVLPALIITVVQSGLTFALTFTVLFGAVDRVQRAATEADRNAIIAGSIGLGGAGLLVLIAVNVFGGALLQGMLVTVAARGAVGERPTAGEAIRAAARRIWPLVGVALLLSALQLVAIVVLALVVIGVATAGTVGVILAIVIGVLGGLGLLVVYGFFTVKLATVPSLIVLERRGVFASIGRSWVLLRGAFWRTFGLIALVFAIVYAATQIVSVPFSILGGAAGGLLFPNAGGDLQGTLSSALLTSIPSLIVTAIVGGIGQIAQVSALVLVYLDRRMRAEGLDLELQRYVEQGGPDPLTPA